MQEFSEKHRSACLRIPSTQHLSGISAPLRILWCGGSFRNSVPAISVFQDFSYHG
jgi:hypothetical protein